MLGFILKHHGASGIFDCQRIKGMSFDVLHMTVFSNDSVSLAFYQLLTQMGVLQEQGSHFPYYGKEFPSPGSQRCSQTNHTIDTI